MTKKTISLASRKKLVGGKLTFNFSHRLQDGIINKIEIKNIKKFKDELIRQGMKPDLNVQLRLIQPKDKKIVTLYFGTVSTPSNPSSYSELVQGNLTRPSAQLRIYGGDTKGIEKGKIYGYSKIDIPISKQTELISNDSDETVHLNHSFLPILIDTRLNQQIFQVDIVHEDGPRLCLNKNLNSGINPKSYFSDNKLLQGVVLQSAISEIYSYIYYSSDRPDWHDHWKEFYKKHTGSSFPDKDNSEEDLQEAIDDIVSVFTSNFNVLNNANKYISQLADQMND